MKITSEQEMLDYGKSFASKLSVPCVIELLGDVGTGKTTFTRGLAEGLGIKEPVTSPSFTISKSYAFKNGELIRMERFFSDGTVGVITDMKKGGNTYFSIKGGFMRIIIVGAGPSGLVCALKSKNDHNEETLYIIYYMYCVDGCW